MPNWGIDVPKGLTLKDTIIYLQAQPRDKVNPNLPIIVTCQGAELEYTTTLHGYIPNQELEHRMVDFIIELAEQPIRKYQVFIK